MKTMRKAKKGGVVAGVAALLLLLSSVVGMAAAAGEAQTALDPGAEAPAALAAPVVTVNGAPFPGEGEGGKIPGCGFSLSITGLPGGEPPSSIGVGVAAVAPSVPEGQKLQLVDDTFLVSTTEWSHEVDLQDAVQALERKPNGYRLELTISIDAVEVGSHVYWVGCDEPQQGHPTRILFDVEWHRLDGTVVSLPPADLPDGWWKVLVLDGQSEKGTATCTFATGDASLACTYDNPGHGDQPGLVVPGNPRATYDVSISGVPGGWLVDPTTIGTFVGRETCPRGGDHDEGENESLNLAVQQDEPEQPRTCTHVVALVEQPRPVVVTTTPTTATVEAVADEPVAEVLAADVSPSSGQLPRTGGDVRPLLVAGGALVVLGAFLTRIARRQEERA